MQGLLSWVFVGVAATALFTPLAHGQSAPVVDKSKSKAARQYVDAGLAAQSTGDYDTAITFYQKAYELVPHPVLWFNMAQAHRLAGRPDQALELYAKYLAAETKGPQAPIARAMVAELEARKAEEARKADEARKVEEDRKLAEAARKQEAHRQAEEVRREKERQAHAGESDRTVATKLESLERESAGSRGQTLRLSGLAAGGIGVVSLGIGIGFGAWASSLSTELSRPGAVYDPAKVDSGRTANRVAIAGIVGGVAAIGVGATLYWLGHSRAQESERITVAPIVSDQTTGLVVSGVLP